SITWQYLSASEGAAVRTGIDGLAAQARTGAPFVQLMLEPERPTPNSPAKFVVRARSWPPGDDVALAECSPHGPPVTWA
ncbi:MAG: DUF2332 family protein, partial [Mycobacterium sp.]|nr:DUF2332 family protein [Mycobacterium sp.]